MFNGGHEHVKDVWLHKTQYFYKHQCVGILKLTCVSLCARACCVTYKKKDLYSYLTQITQILKDDHTCVPRQQRTRRDNFIKDYY